MALGCLHRSLAVEEWGALKYGYHKDDSFERPVGAFDLFILDAAPEGDLDDVRAGSPGSLSCCFQPYLHINVVDDRD